MSGGRFLGGFPALGVKNHVFYRDFCNLTLKRQCVLATDAQFTVQNGPCFSEIACFTALWEGTFQDFPYFAGENADHFANCTVFWPFLGAPYGQTACVRGHFRPNMPNPTLFDLGGPRKGGTLSKARALEKKGLLQHQF